MTTDTAVRLVPLGGRVYQVWLRAGGPKLGEVWATVHTEVRWNPGGRTTNKVHPSKLVTYWKATGSEDDFHTRRDAVEDLVARHAD